MTVEGEATAHYISELVRARKMRATRIAYGVPVGGELEYVDQGTLARLLLDPPTATPIAHRLQLE